MKNFNKLFGSLLLAFVVMGLASIHSGAASGVRSPKKSYLYAYSTAISSITPFTVVESTSGIFKSGAVYQLNLSTGATGDYFVLYDTNAANASALSTPCSAAALTNCMYQLGPRFFYQSTGTVTSTSITFDPPLYFENGLMIWGSAANEEVSVTYELGRGLSGQ